MSTSALELPLPARRAPVLFSLTVYGTPEPAGSKRVVPMGGRYGVIDANKKSRPWKDLVSQEAGKVMAGRSLLEGPLEVRFTFYVRRPQGHFGKRGLLGSAPPFPAKKPDALKLARGVEDALSGCVYRDDAQIVVELLEKRYGTPERVEIEIREAVESVGGPWASASERESLTLPEAS